MSASADLAGLETRVDPAEKHEQAQHRYEPADYTLLGSIAFFLSFASNEPCACGAPLRMKLILPYPYFQRKVRGSPVERQAA